jgi:dipeptidase E
MKLFLSSLTVSADHLPRFIELVGKKPDQIKLGLIENAIDVFEGTPAWVGAHRDTLKGHGMHIEHIDLREFSDPAKLHKTLSDLDVIWVGGGNTFYLRYILSKSGADKIIAELVGKGTVYAGSSAGAIVAGPTLNHFQEADNAELSPELILTGMELTDVVVVPHFGDTKSASINTALTEAGYNTAPLTNAQALVIDGPRHHRI